MPWKLTHNGVDYLVTDRWSIANESDARNIYAEIRDLDGAHPKDIFGEDVPLGEISFTVWEPDTCGCAHRHLARHDTKEVVPHRALRLCEAHKHHGGNHKGHYADILRENQHKNNIVNAHAEKHEIDPLDITFGYDDKRQLVLSHPAFGKKVILQPKAN